MKIGILTFHRAINYGAILQAYALQQTLRSLGHEVWIIDYRQPRVERTDRCPFQKGDRLKLIRGFHLRAFLNYNKNKDIVLKRRIRFDEFINNNLRLTEPCHQNNIPPFDIYVVGSDQVWNSKICDGLDNVFWGNFLHPQNSKIVSYAASTSVKDLKDHQKDNIQQYLINFSFISVREEETCDYLNNNYLLNRECKTVLDPTLLADKSIWDALINDKYKNENFVLYFGARGCALYPSVLYDKADSLANLYNCSVKNIDFNSDSPVDFINKFRYARAVVTSSFHGVAFSLIFNKPLYAVQYRDEQDARYVNVLKSIGAEKMLIDLYEDIKPNEYDYSLINEDINKLRIHSLDYLKQL